MRAGRDFDGPIGERDCGKTEADDQHIGREQEIRKFLEQRTLVVDVKLLMNGTSQRCVAAPLISDDAVFHRLVEDFEDFGIEKEFGCEAGRFEWHGKEMAVGTAIRRFAVLIEVIDKDRPERFAAGVEERCGEMSVEDAEALIAQMCEVRVEGHSGA